jgi:transposase-like protein
MISTEAKAHRFATLHGLVDVTRLCACGRTMHIRPDASKPYGCIFECMSSRRICGKRKSALADSWFARSNLGLRHSLLAIAGYAAELDYRQMRFTCELGSDTTIADWKNYFRSACAEECLVWNFQKIGGIGTTVEVDESLIFKRKNHVGRLLYSEIEHTWVVGGICRETRECFAVRVQDRSEQTLSAVLTQHILKGTKIITDCWRGYQKLDEQGFFHSKVNHSQNFVDPSDPLIHTNTIERQWRVLKELIPNGCHGENRYDYLAEYIWKARKHWNILTVGERMKEIIGTISKLKFNYQ